MLYRIAVIASISSVLGQVEPPAAAVCGTGGSGAQEIGEKTYVCITFNGRKRALFTPKLDDFSLITIDNSERSPSLPCAAYVYMM